jgi:hypothetical protein
MQIPLYLTTDLSLSAFLQVKGHEIVEVRKEQGRGIFAFDDTPELKKDILRWGNNEAVPIRVRGFVNGMRDLKGLVGV